MVRPGLFWLARRVAFSLDGIIQQFRKLDAGFAAGWQRYVVLSLLLASVLIEFLVFAGSNTLHRPIRPALGDYDRGVDALFTRIDTGRVAEPVLITNEETPAGPATPRMAPTAARRTSGDAKKIKEEAPAFSRVIIERPSRRPNIDAVRQVTPSPPAAQQSRAPIPAATVPNREFRPSALQLNVKWEN